MAVPLTRNAFAEKHPDIFAVFSKRTENVLFSFFLHKTTQRYSFRKIFAVLSIILRLKKRELNFWETIIIIIIIIMIIIIIGCCCCYISTQASSNFKACADWPILRGTRRSDYLITGRARCTSEVREEASTPFLSSCVLDISSFAPTTKL